MYKLIEWIRLLTISTDAYSVNSDLSSINIDETMQMAVNRKRHTKYFERCLNVLPPRLASHDSTRFLNITLISDSFNPNVNSLNDIDFIIVG